MKLKPNIAISVLTDYGFEKLDDQYKENNALSEDDVLYYQKGYAFYIGHSRRGQLYYLICSDYGNFSILATKPDGSGGPVELETDIFIRLVSDSIVE